MLRCEALSSFSSDSQKMLPSSLIWSTCTVAECGKASPAASRTLVRSPRSPESLFRHASDHLLRFALFSPNPISIFPSHSTSLSLMADLYWYTSELILRFSGTTPTPSLI